MPTLADAQSSFGFPPRPAQRPMTGGLLYCRIRAFESDRVEFETIYHRDDGSERIGKPSRLPLDGFLELS
ncbi:MAG: hypothetical protein M3072_08400 [Candidatus Dormibacteraeota bacterium]|nr:hypothetical protein [Candidatus Dormibacteraeota bacterium]